MKTGTCLRPSWTAIVCPTISGKIVEARDQVRTMFLLPDSFIASIRLISRSSTNGPFFDDLLTSGDPPCRGDGRGRSACPIPCAYGGGGCPGRGRPPARARGGAGPPHGVTGWRPPFDLPSPPPCGWSTGFIAEPRTDGRFPRQRLRPALPPVMFWWSTFPTWPTVARQSSGTRRISPDGRRRTANAPSFATSWMPEPADRAILAPWPGFSPTAWTSAPVG